jgi:hypothetical protein
MSDQSQTASSAHGSTASVNSAPWWDERFVPGGTWETSGGRQQTRLFAEALCRHIGLQRREPFTLCDFGCALGEALKVFKRRFPQAILFGIDFSSTAISRCKAESPGLAEFSVGSFESLSRQFEVIYASNILEHFLAYEEKARLLLSHCRRLLVMVPFQELLPGELTEPPPESQHQRSFTQRSFDFLIAEGLARCVDSKVVWCPGAWGWTWTQRLKEEAKNLVRCFLDRPRADRPLQIIFDISRARTDGGDGAVPVRPSEE